MIESYSFGRMTAHGHVYTDDVLMCREMLISPWWRQRGHVVTLQDLAPVLDHKPEILILGQGKPGQMKAAPDLQGQLQQLGIDLVQVPTEEAVRRFNRHLEQEDHVCGGFHLTC